MLIRNPLFSLIRNSLFGAVGKRRSRIRRWRETPLNVAAEVLEIRSLLSSANVAAAVAGSALTLTSDNNGDHHVEVYRLDANHVDVVATNPATTINGGASAIFFLPSLSGITVNLGSTADSYLIDSKAGSPALNIGSGGVTFQGAGGTVDDLEILNNSTSDMAILGNVTVQGTTAGSALAVSGSTETQCDVALTSSGNLTIAGSVSLDLSGSGIGPEYNQIYTLGSGNLHIQGSVNSTTSESNVGYQNNEVFANGTGNLVIDGNVIQAALGAAGAAENSVSAAGQPANLIIHGGVGQSAKGGTGSRINDVSAFSNVGGSVLIDQGVVQVAVGNGRVVTNEVILSGSGSITIGPTGGSLVQSAQNSGESHAAENDLFTDPSGTGFLAIGGAVGQSAKSQYKEINHIFNGGSGGMTIGQQVVQTGAVSSSKVTENYLYNDSASAFTILGSITQTAVSSSSIDNKVDNLLNGSMYIGGSITENATASAGTVSDHVYTSTGGLIYVGGGITINESNAATLSAIFDVSNMVYTLGSGPITTVGRIVINANNSGTGSTLNAVESSGNAEGAISTAGIVFLSMGSETELNYVEGDGGALKVGSLGVKFYGTGSGFHNDEILTEIDNSPVTIAGSVNMLDNGTGHNQLTISAAANNSGISIGGDVNYNDGANLTGRSTVDFHGDTSLVNSIVTIGGSLTIRMAGTAGSAADNQGADHNFAHLGNANSNPGYGLVVNGTALIDGGNGRDVVMLQQAQLKMGGTIDLQGNPGTAGSNDVLLINGSAIGGNLAVSMSGPNALLSINSGVAFQPDLFSGAFTANLTGDHPLAYIADGSGVGFSPVTFSAGAVFVGTVGAGGVVEYHTANVTGSVSGVNFTVTAI